MRPNIKKLAVGGMLVALTVALSGFYIPIGASKCYPVQHLVNILCAVFLGPSYGVASAFCSSLIRNLMGTGSLLAFPGSMVGALLAGLLYKKSKKLIFAYVGELFGTGILGGILCFPVASFLMGKTVAVFAFVLPFFLSSLAGTCIAVILTGALYKSGLLENLQRSLKGGALS
ncbi:energy coupling factor transporter S component ThiW [Qiania dongpingensis]|uniref:Energy coupling factor transporter S component ThiW n=1 Tax=Qiania dongpingensis TaxID=2763669 RepID=A0A7G9G352_9FIRM|nr:energy coupling factor transporter S component ThiW [Qiania dongpingensis]QNM05234.1 energy coupling factor transporter S component ThiW [Qiania dongpingensis]